MQFCRRRRFKGLTFRLDYGKKRGCTREEKEQERLKHKYKKEFKGALRELRKDSRFLAREKLNEVIQRCERNTLNIGVKAAKVETAKLCFIFVLQRYGEEEEGEGALWQFGLSGGGVEGPEEEEEKVNIRICTRLPLTCSLFKQPEEKSAFKHLELNFFCFLV